MPNTIINGWYNPLLGPLQGTRYSPDKITGPLKRLWKAGVGGNTTDGWVVDTRAGLCVPIKTSAAEMWMLDDRKVAWCAKGIRKDSPVTSTGESLLVSSKSGAATSVTRVLCASSGKTMAEWEKEIRPIYVDEAQIVAKVQWLEGKDRLCRGDALLIDAKRMEITRSFDLERGPSMCDGRLMAVKTANHLVIYDVVTGKETAREPSSQEEEILALSKDGVLLSYAADPKRLEAMLYAREMTSGKLLWNTRWFLLNTERFAISGDVMVLGESAAKDNVSGLPRTSRLRGISIRSGTTLWSQAIGENMAFEWPICTDDVVWYIDRDHLASKTFLVCREVNSGQELHKQEVGTKRNLWLAAAIGGCLLVREGHSLVCYRGC